MNPWPCTVLPTQLYGGWKIQDKLQSKTKSYLLMELSIDNERCVILSFPFLRGGAEVTPRHANSLGQRPGARGGRLADMAG